MTVSTEVDHNDYTGNGVTTSFPYTFRIFKKSDLTVQVADLNENITALTLDTDYSVTGAGTYSGGNVVLMSPLANGWQISISRDLPVTQETDLRNQGKFFAEVHEDAFDKLTMLIQQCFSFLRLALRKPSFIANYYDALNNRIRNLRDPSQAQDAATKGYADNLYQGAISHSDNNFKRTLRVPESEVGMLPGISGRRKKILAFNDTGNPIAVLPESGSAADVMIELAAGDGAKLVGGLNYVTPEMSGFVTGIGDADADTAAFQWALNQNGAKIVLDSTKTYHIHRDVLKHTGRVDIHAGTATIVCDGVFLEVTEGHHSVWRGGILKSESTPFTVVYDEQFNIVESGFLGYGRMPFHSEDRVDPQYFYQDICCTLVFKAASSNPVNGLSVSDVTGDYASVIACGYINTKFDNCHIRGGAANAAISIRNHSVDLPTQRYGNETSETNKNAFKWARGKNHTITGCTLYESRANGLAVAGSDYVTVSGCRFIDNSESGLKLEQYVVRTWTDTDNANKYVTVTDCYASGSWYDGFDVQAAYGSGRPTNLDLYLIMDSCFAIKNRQVGVYGNGNNAKLSGLTVEGNGRHGIAYEDSYHCDIINCDSRNNGWVVAGQYQIRVTGSDNSIQDCTAYLSAALVTNGGVAYQVIDTDNTNIGTMAVRILRGRYLRNFTNYPTRVLIAAGVMTEEFKKNNPSTDSKRRLSTVWQILIFLRG